MTSIYTVKTQHGDILSRKHSVIAASCRIHPLRVRYTRGTCFVSDPNLESRHDF